MRASPALTLGAPMRPYCSRLWYHACLELVPNALAENRRAIALALMQEADRAETEQEAYLALIAARDPEIRALLDQGFAFVTNAFKADAAPSGMQAKTDRAHMRRLQQAGYQVAVSTAYDEQGHPRPTLSAIWRKKP